MPQVFVRADIDWIMGHLRYGYKQGDLFIPDEEWEEFKTNPAKYLRETGLIWDLDLVIDDYRVDDIGPIGDVYYKEVDENGEDLVNK